MRSVEQIPHEDYCHLTEEFTAENYNPREWARLAKKAGMKYAVLTAKHHDGFCLFDTKLTDYNSMNAACHKDLVKEFLEAFRAEGIKVGLYFSIIDWRHPDFPHYGDMHHPMPVSYTHLKETMIVCQKYMPDYTDCGKNHKSACWMLDEMAQEVNSDEK